MMSDECWRYSTNTSTAKLSFSCVCGCCGGSYNRYCCDPSYCDPNNRGFYLSEGTVIALLCIVVLVLIGAIVALILVCRMKKRSGTTSYPDEKSQQMYTNDHDYPQEEMYNPPYYISSSLGEQRQLRAEQNRQISSC